MEPVERRRQEFEIGSRCFLADRRGHNTLSHRQYLRLDGDNESMRRRELKRESIRLRRASDGGCGVQSDKLFATQPKDVETCQKNAQAHEAAGGDARQAVE